MGKTNIFNTISALSDALENSRQENLKLRALLKEYHTMAVKLVMPTEKELQDISILSSELLN